MPTLISSYFGVTVVDPLLRIKNHSLILTDYGIFTPTYISSLFIDECVFKDDKLTQLGHKHVEASELLNGNRGFTSTAT
jgi:hypothetical protein